MALFSDAKFSFPVGQEKFYQITIYEIVTNTPIRQICYTENTPEEAQAIRSCKGYDPTVWRIETRQVSRDDYLESRFRADTSKLAHAV